MTKMISFSRIIIIIQNKIITKNNSFSKPEDALSATRNNHGLSGIEEAGRNNTRAVKQLIIDFGQNSSVVKLTN